jgi:hypothetical protein
VNVFNGFLVRKTLAKKQAIGDTDATRPWPKKLRLIGNSHGCRIKVVRRENNGQCLVPVD